MTDTVLSPIELYLKKALKWQILLTTLGVLCASCTFTAFKIAGFYPMVSLPLLIAFDVFDILIFVLGQILTRKSVAPDGSFRREYIHYTKIFIFALVIIQWNIITYMVPSRDFWAYASLFVLVTLFYVDPTFTLFTEIGIAISMSVGWFLQGEILGAARDEFFLTNTILRIILIVLFFIFLWFIAYFLREMLVKPMETIADCDTLTGLRNRRTLYRIVNEAIEKNRAAGRSVTVLFCDIDDFKVQNDTWGHDFGDRILQGVAQAIQSVLPKNSIPFRYGGEEFIIMVDAEPVAALKVAEAVRASVDAMRIEAPDHSADVAVSLTIGAASSLSPESDADSLITLSDQRMYEGKLAGKNRVVSATDLP